MYYSVNEWNLVIFDAAVEKKKKIDSLQSNSRGLFLLLEETRKQTFK